MQAIENPASMFGEVHSLSGDTDMGLEQLLSSFVTRLRHRQDALLVVLGRGDTATALRLLHQLEGTSAMYGLSRVAEQARQISSAVSRYDLRAAVALARNISDQSLALTA